MMYAKILEVKKEERSKINKKTEEHLIENHYQCADEKFYQIFHLKKKNKKLFHKTKEQGQD